jgi:hypothetical protein
LHCGQEYDRFRIEWRIERNANGEAHGFWCCPIPGCDGKGFGFYVFPVDSDFRDERGGWFYDDAPDDGDEKPEPRGAKAPAGSTDATDDDIPW